MTGKFESAKVIVEVIAGLIPGKDPIPEFTRRWALTSEEWDRATDPNEALAILNGKALGYAALLMLQPSRLNWVRTDWIWL